FADVLEALSQRRSRPFARGPDYWACDSIKLYEQVNPFGAEVYSISPSHQTISDARADIARLIPRIGNAVRRFPVVAPNDLSVVLLVKTNGLNLLLGADLEQGQDDLRGWRAVVASALRPSVISSVYKIAHHGSQGADLDEIWTVLVGQGATAVL